MRFYEFVLPHTLFPSYTRSCLAAHAPKPAHALNLAAHALNLAAHALCITSLHTLLDESRQNFVSIFSTVFFFSTDFANFFWLIFGSLIFRQFFVLLKF